MTPTILTLFGKQYRLPSEKLAYLEALEAFLIIKPDLFTNPRWARYVCKGRDGDPLFAQNPIGMRQPARFAGCWYAKTCLSNNQKVRNLDKLGQYSDLKRGRDWHWQTEYRLNPEFIDVDALLAKL